ncbi:hypothetical protein JTB14_024905 [Gonioctena quinquepunctata]|nr:hypothetical protein JTB14_024905 [Gonioctena quinquepunctata]
MDMSFFHYQEACTSYASRSLLTMDYDSGYISHNPESNLDSSSENITEIIKEPSLCLSEDAFLSEDALLERPEINKFSNLSVEIDKEDYEETRKLFNSSDIGSESILPNSTESQELSYNGFDKDYDNSDFEIPCVNKIIVANFSEISALNSTHNSYEDQTIEDHTSQERSNDGFVGFSQNQKFPMTAFSNITNTLATNDPKKKLTLIFSKSDKENIYSVKRKYHSLTPDRSFTENNNDGLQLHPIVQQDITSDTFANDICSEQKQHILDSSFEDKSIVIEETEDVSKFGAFESNISIPELSSNNLMHTPGHEQIENKNRHVEIKNEPEKEQNMTENKEIIVDEIDVNEENVPKNHSIEEKMKAAESKPSHHSDLLTENFITEMPSLPETPKKSYHNSFCGSASPDLFEEQVEKKIQILQPLPCIKEERYLYRKDRIILRRAQNNLKGVLPPHSMTIIQMSLDEMLNKIELNKDYFWNESRTKQRADSLTMGIDSSSNTKNNDLSPNDSSDMGISKSLLISCSLEECIGRGFPNILEDRCHGLYHNRSKLSEEFEDLCMKYGQRYVGAETQSSCCVFEVNCLSPMKRKQMKQRWAVKSPGKRLSHLAKRRITFSSSSLQTCSSISTGFRARQILVDPKKLELMSRRKSPRKTPKKTPGKSPRTKTRTPSSSAKKKLAMRFRKLTGEIEKTSTPSDKTLSSKRALFTSPECDKKSSLFLPSTSGVSVFENEVKKSSTKRALFMSPSKKSPIKNSPFKRSPFKRSPFKRLDLGLDKKRKRTDSENMQPSKLPRSLSMDIRPSESIHKSFDRTKSDTNLYQNRNHVVELNAVHKKKLQWAVYEALRSQNVTPAHPQFKLFASILARLTRRFLPNLSANIPRPEGGSTTERMLRIARHHVFSVIKGKSVDEIYNEYMKVRAKNSKPHGYVSLNEFAGDKKGINKENSLYEDIRRSLQKKMPECSSSSVGENKIERIRKVINFGDDNR